ncbi:DUF4345 domain-containing protein [Flammeovirga sp. SubArs3]|uniref:DUF4345 domain-containing protein n=1 Tax=Flammeovirga sp. SubArs3 TaxID=2995316 RepID=UPI00248AE73F|nr:DUF4345 domain-containing protein [Flammeovirga sp. SubArs3]
MKNSKTLKVYLLLSGILLSIIGALTSFNPIEIKANEGIILAGNPSALNDVRSFGMLLIATALFSSIGVFKESIRKPAIISVFTLFLSLGLGRVLSIALDGFPSDGILKATVLELVLGIIGVTLFSVYKNKSTSTH